MLKFTKMQGVGNDYIYFNCFDQIIDNPETLSIRLSDRHFGVGGDGIILIMPSKVADARMRIFNADGSEGKMCGNGIRCVGKYVYDNGIVDKTDITVETASGIKKIKLFLKDGKVDEALVNMGVPNFNCVDIPVAAESDTFIKKPVFVLGTEYKLTAVSMGNPHAVTFVDEVDKLKLEEIGPLFENNSLFPERVNTEFVKVISPKNLKMRVWERGSGETLACGTGACAVLAAAVENGISPKNEEVEIELLGGSLFITYSDDGMLMRGKAETVFNGEI